MPRTFTHRAAFGAWINDMRNDGMPTEKWPHVAVDHQTIADCQRCLELQAQSGFNEFDVFGLFTSYAWPLDIASAVSPDRQQLVETLLETAHQLDIRVLCGLGVYSWGFDEIIAQRPEVRGDNPRAMCASKDASWQWMTRVIDYVLTNFPVDGFHLESSDQGRCSCPECAHLGNVEYHCKLNARVADYVRAHWPNKLLMVNMCGYVPWGTILTPDEREHIIGLSEHLDILIDPGHVGHGVVDNESRPSFIQSLACDFGTSGGAWVYPPQRWHRLRWFLPHTEQTGRHLRKLYEEGGRAIDYYMGPIINPGVEMNIAFGGRLLANVDQSNEEALTEIVGGLYSPRTQADLERVIRIFQRAEAAYYDSFHPFPPRSRESPGELHLAPLFGREPGPAIYLGGTRPDDQPLESVGIGIYQSELISLLKEVESLAGSMDDEGRLERIAICIKGALDDLDAL